MGDYASFHDKQAPPPVTVHAGPVYASGAIPANMVSVLEDYYCPDTEDMTFSASAIPKKGVQKVAGKKPKTKVNVPRLQRAVDQGLLDDDEELTPIEDMDELEDAPISTETQHIIPSTPQKLKQMPPTHSSSDNPPTTRTIKTGKVQELVQSQRPRLSDPIRGIAGRARFDVKKIFDLPLEVTLGEFLDQSDITIKELAYNMQKTTPRYRIRKAKTGNALQQDHLPATSSNAVLHPSPITSSACDNDG